MKKALRLLAVLMAAVMIFSAAYLPAYAKIKANDYTVPKVSDDLRYYFTPEQGAGYILDLLDGLLKDANLYITMNEDLGLSDFVCGLINIKIDAIDLRSIDSAVYSIYRLVTDLDNGFISNVADALGAFGSLFDDVTVNSLNTEIKRGTRESGYAGGTDDLNVLYMLISWLNELAPTVKKIIMGNFDWGLLTSILTDNVPMLADIVGYLKDMLYTSLIDSEAEAWPAGTTLDAEVQKLINWALITGTGENSADGGFSLLGANAEPLMPAVGDQPGGASLGGETIQVDRNGDGVLETVTMSFYQLVNNVIQGLLNGTLKDLLLDLLVDLMGIEVTPEQPGGDPAILQDMTFNLVVGLIEGLSVQNGAPAPTYTEEQNATPLGKVNALLDWFLMDGGGLDTFISIDYYGINLTDNFMSLLNDIARLGINLLPGLAPDMFNTALAYTSDELNAVYYYTATKDRVLEGDELAVGQLYRTYETNALIYAAETDADGKPTAYNFLDSDYPVNTTNKDASDYVNPALIRSDYVISTQEVFACLIKMLLDGIIDGCYWPEWTTSVSSVLAYALAALAAPVLPEGNYFERLDAYHLNGAQAYSNEAGLIVDPIPYETVMSYQKGGVTKYVTIPYAALDIGASVAAFYLNGVFRFNNPLTEIGSNLEIFATEFLAWALDTYMPMLVGEYNPATKNFEGDGIWCTAFNTLIDSFYSDFGNGTLLADPDESAIYSFLDKTLFGLLPSDWLPDTYQGSFEFVNCWLLENLVNFDLQGILSLFSVNPTGELNSPVTTILLRIIDRLLATVFNGNPLLPPVNDTRMGTDANGVPKVYTNFTTVTTLDGLLDNSSDSAALCVLITQLLGLLNRYKVPLCITLMPLLVSGFDKPYDKEFGADGTVTDSNWLGTDMTAWKVEDLETYYDHFMTDVNAVQVAGPFENEEDAQTYIDDAVKADYTRSFYIKTEEVEGETVVNENGEEEAVYEYYVYEEISFYTTATMATGTDEAGTVYTFSGFKYAALDVRGTNPYVWYDSDYRLYEAEDFKSDLYAYRNLKEALKDGKAYADSYRAFTETTICDAYGEWMAFAIQTRLKQADIYDSNQDGYSVENDTAADYVAPTTDDAGNVTNPGIPSDGNPGAPGAIYPFYTTTSTNYNFLVDRQEVDAYQTFNSADYTAANYEQIQLALDYAADPDHNVVLDNARAEDVVRLAMGNMDFDITLNSAGAYNGSKQWEHLTATDIANINNMCASLGYTFVYDTENEIYEIQRPAFALMTSGVTFGYGTSAIPATAPSGAKDPTYAQEVADQMYTSYCQYMEDMYYQRKSLYNAIDYISDRAEQAYSFRSGNIDTTMLKWALAHTADAYKSTAGKRNQQISGVVDGQIQYTKIYTQKSYDRFQKAYDYATSLNLASTGVISANGLTQSMVSNIFAELMDAYKSLILYTGDADWTQLDEYINFAVGIRDDENKDDPFLGYSTESYNALVAELNNALAVRADSTIDCETQDIVDQAAAELLTKINNLDYNSEPQIQESATAGGSTQVDVTTSTGARTIGHVYGLVESVGIQEGLVEVIGMRIDEGVGNKIEIQDSGRGRGTGAFYKGSIGNIERFRFYAIVYGDINGDARIDGTDRTALDLAIILGENNSAEEGGMGAVKFEAADVNHDGVVTAEDAQAVENHYNYVEAISQDTHSPIAQVTAE